MLKKNIEFIIKKIKNKDFMFDPSISNSCIREFFTIKSIDLIRGFFSFNFGKKGKFFFLASHVQFFNKKNIFLGNTVNIERYCKLSGLGIHPLEIGNNVTIGAFSQIIISSSFHKIGQYIRIEDNVGIGEYAYIGGAGGTTIGKNTIIGQYFSVHPENHCFENKEIPIRLQQTTRKGIQIGQNCWIGAKVTILDGVTIGNNCVIAAGSIVTKSAEANSVYAGVPAKKIRDL
jgi:acetyltransferase-like isoleucine patch superfamily enzyme